MSHLASPQWASHSSATGAQFKLLRVRGDTKDMRQLLLLSLVLCLSTSSGCMVLDELDSSAAMLPANQKAKEQKEQSDGGESDAASAALRTKQELLEQSRQWWKRATSLTPRDIESSIVSCRLRDGTHFMSEDDCLSRGGRPKGVSG